MNNTTTSFTKEQLIEQCIAEIELAQITIRNGGSDTPRAVEARSRLYEIALAALESNDARSVEQSALEALPEQRWEELCRQHPEMSIGDAIVRAAWWNFCRAEMLKSISGAGPEGAEGAASLDIGL